MKIERRDTLRLLSIAGFASLFGFRANPSHAQCITTPDILGPFYLPGAPQTAMLAPENAPGTPIFITGTVFANDCETPLVEAEVDVWHASDAGDYSDEAYRGILSTNASGQYAFQSVLPGKYLNGAQFRPRHFHYIIRKEEVELTTQIYFEGDTSIPIDPWASSPEAEERIIPLSEDSEGNLHGVADIYLDIPPPINSTEEHQRSKSQSSILNLTPNPMYADGSVSIYLHRAAQVALEVYSLHGKKVASWIVPQHLPAGRLNIPVNSLNRHGLSMQPQVYVLLLSIDQQIADARRFVIGQTK